MNARFPLLGQIDAQALHLHELNQWLLRRGIEASWEPLPALPCLRFELGGPQGQLVCQVQIADWARYHLPELQGLDWSQLDHATLSGLCSIEQPLSLLVPLGNFPSARFLGLSLAGQQTLVYPQIVAKEGWVWLEQVHWRGPTAEPPIQVSGNERLPVKLRLGRTRKPVHLLRRLKPGDILLLPSARPQAWRADRCLFDFSLLPESVVVTMTYPTEADQSAMLLSQVAHEQDRTVDPLDLASLPLTLDIVLTTLQLSLAELSDLAAGSTLRLNEMAYRGVRIEHNGHCVASGELVQVGSTLGVQLTQAPRLK
ncbi:FliM/FliN family flagellar motor switch protein [Stenotrophomonas indicatrix]|uniref:FliM/FliN family flagellar motor switch protein n=1 Tax=Stenotrophomonas indicatrix TaxID=2045451 RepID=UPI00300A1003